MAEYFNQFADIFRTMPFWVYIILIIPALLITISILGRINNVHRVNRVIKSAEVFESAEAFEERRKNQPSISGVKDFPGCYILSNTKTGKEYVGQSVHVLLRVHSHLAGSGNHMVHFAILKGNSFAIRVMPFEGSGFKNLNKMEKALIKKCGTYKRGYNRTRGNN